MATPTAQPQVTAPVPYSPQHPSGSLYVGDLAPDVTEATLFEVFSRAGAVSSIRVCRDASTRRSLGYAYVNFHSFVDAERALDTLNFSTIKDRPCRIMWSHRDPSIRKNPKNNIFIKNLATEIDSKQLYDTFSKFGSILSCKVATDPMTGVSRGFGYVHFESEDSATKAINDVNGHMIAGKAVYVGKFERKSERQAGTSKFTNVYVKNIPREWDEAEFKNRFEAYGAVTSVALRRGDDKYKGCSHGFVNYDKHEEAERAIQQGNMLTFNGETMYCSRFQKKSERMNYLAKQYDDRRRAKMDQYKDLNLYVKNLDEEIDDAKLQELFTPFGNISSAVVMKEPNSQHSRGFGFVCFTSSEDANRALADMNGKVVGSKPLYVNRAQRREERRMQLENTFLSGPRMQPMMFFQPNVPMQPQFMMAPYRRAQPVPTPPPMRYPQQGGPYYPPNPMRGGRGRGQPMRGGMMFPQGGRGRGMGRGGPQVPRTQPMMPNMQELSSTVLANATPEAQKQILGERLYPLVYKENPKLAAKITGMFLEMETSEILALLDSPAELHSKIQEAMTVLESSQPN